jgi:hypothetical protein
MVVSKKLLKNDGSVKIFNIAKNSGEVDLSEGCSDAEACTNLAGNEDFRQIEIALMDKWKVFRDLAGPSSTISFQDDGPLCNPALFGGSWASWRDEEGVPYATYSTVSTSQHFGANELSSSGGVSEQVDGAGHANKEKGDSDGSGSNTWKQQAKITVQEKSVNLAAAESASSSSSSSPYALVAAGSVLGAVVALAAVVVAQRLRPSDRTEFVRAVAYAPVGTEECL